MTHADEPIAGAKSATGDLGETGDTGDTGDTGVLVSAVEVGKTWSPTASLAPLSFTLARGDSVVLQGRSGSGKSTLLGILAGWCEADRGALTRFGAWAANGRWRTWEGTAIVPQTLGLLPELPLRENISLGLRLAGLDRRSVAARTIEMLHVLDLVDEANRLPSEVSLGQRQRAAVARAVVSAPTLLLADEPTCHQDSVHAALVLEAVARVTHAGGAVLIASHDEAVIAAGERLLSLD